ncbi:response regulator [Candidatus Bathyarchaeota archaeon]|nr:response regulator [Candidatus Bathyarchaeota archaeon]
MVKKIFIVEDNEKNMSLFNAILKTIPDIEVKSAERGDEGFEMIKQGEPDLIILDVQLPGMNGIEICKELRKIEKFNELPIIAVTAFTMKGDQERIMAAGFTEYISKPIRVKNFKETVSGYIT